MTLEVITSDALARMRHGFFTRRGGASSGLFASLNCGFGSTDRQETVAANRKRVADALGLSPKRLATVHQGALGQGTCNGHPRSMCGRKPMQWPRRRLASASPS